MLFVYQLAKEPLLDITGNREPFEAIYNEYSENNVVKFLTVDTRNPSSILNSLQYARDNARTITDVIPREVISKHRKWKPEHKSKKAKQSPR